MSNRGWDSRRLDARLVSKAWIDSIELSEQRAPCERVGDVAHALVLAERNIFLDHAWCGWVIVMTQQARADLHRASTLQVIHTHESFGAGAADGERAVVFQQH